MVIKDNIFRPKKSHNKSTDVISNIDTSIIHLTDPWSLHLVSSPLKLFHFWYFLLVCGALTPPDFPVRKKRHHKKLIITDIQTVFDHKLYCFSTKDKTGSIAWVFIPKEFLGQGLWRFPDGCRHSQHHQHPKGRKKVKINLYLICSCSSCVNYFNFRAVCNSWMPEALPDCKLNFTHWKTSDGLNNQYIYFLLYVFIGT